MEISETGRGGKTPFSRFWEIRGILEASEAEILRYHTLMRNRDFTLAPWQIVTFRPARPAQT